jgi:molybdate transport system ATP-binding protein
VALRADVEARVGALDIRADLRVARGQCLALAGPSGAGKTTMLRIVAGLVEPHRGRVECGGSVWLDTKTATNRPPEERAVGYLFQEYALFETMSVWRNVAYALRSRDRRAQALELLERFGVAHLADARPGTLSGGERQRVALARALARKPAALLLDEPLSALDTRTRGAASRVLAEVLRESDVPALLVTHDFAEAAELADRIAIIDDGRVLQEGTATELAAAPATAFVADFTGAVVLTGHARARPDGLTEVQLDGGGTLTSTDRAEGRVGASVHPWEITLEPPGSAASGSAQNRIAAEVASVTVIGNRARVGLRAGQPLVAEVTEPALRRLQLEPGSHVVASFKAAATRLVPH